MNRSDTKLWGVLVLVLGLAGGFAAFAQDEPVVDEPVVEESAEPAGGDATDAPDLSVGDGEGEEEPAKPVKPRPAEIMPLAAKTMLLDIQKVDGQYVAVGDRGNIVRSADGKTWEQVNVPVRSPLTAVHFADPQTGYAVGHDAAVVATKDGGKTWVLQNFQPELEKPFLDVLFLDANRGFAVGAYALFAVTTDGGKTWGEADAPAVRDEELHFNSITRLNNGDLLIAGEQGMLGLSTDAGATWQRLQSPYESSLFGALPVGEKGALIYGLRGNVFVSTDVGAGQWKELDSGSVASMFGGTVLPDGRLALVGLNGVVFIADAEGQVTRQKADAGTPLSAAIPFEDGLLAVGESGVQQIKLR